MTAGTSVRRNVSWRGGKGWGAVRDRKQNKRQTQEIVIQVDISMCDARHVTDCHLHMMTKSLINTPSLIGCNTE